MNIVILGPQGSGKGTQAEFLVQKFQLFYISTGDILRELAKRNSEIAKTIAKGDLIPDREMFSIINNHLDKNDVKDNILFDGYPRSVAQLKIFEESGRKIDLVIVLNISDDESVKRLSARRMDSRTGKIYNLLTNLPPSDVPVSDLVQREDDKPEAIRRRLAIYHKNTGAEIEDLKKVTHVYEINAERPIEDIQKDLERIVTEYKSS